MIDNTDSKPLPLPNEDTTQKVPNDQAKFDFRRYGLIAACLIPFLICASYLLVRFFTAVAAVIPPFGAAFVISLLLDPIVDRIERRGIHRVIAVTAVFITFVAALVIISIVALPVIVSQASSLASNTSAFVANLTTTVNSFLSHDHPFWSLHLHRTAPGKWAIIWHARKIWTLNLPKNFDVLSQQVINQIGAFIQKSFGDITVVLVGSVSTLFDLLITFILTFYLLVDIDKIRARFYFLTPEKYRKRVSEIGQDVGQVFADYLRGLLVVCLLYGLSTTLLLYALAYLPDLGHPALAQYALLIGASAGVLYAIPYIGSITVGIVTFLVALAAGDFGFAAIAVLATLVLNQTFDNVIAPRIVGGGLGLNPVLVILSLSLGGALFGFWGLLFSVPIAGSVQVVLFRLIPKLTQPTPPAFLAAHGVPPGKSGATSKLMHEPPPEILAKEAEERLLAAQKLERDVEAENAEAPN